VPLPRNRIGIAVVEHAGRYLVGVRPANGPLPGFAEFPGGKCRIGESPASCAIRECAEETGLRVEVVELLDRRTFDYPHATVDLHFFLCRPADPATVTENQQAFRWVNATELRNLQFPPANRGILELLIERALQSLP